MYRRTAHLIFATALALQSALALHGEQTTELRSAAAVTRTAFVDGTRGIPFELDCTVLLDSPAGQPDVSVADDSGATILRKDDTVLSFSAGERLHVRGTTTEKNPGQICAKIIVYERRGRAAIAPPVAATPKDIESGRLDCRPVRISGTVIDFFQDEFDATYAYLVFDCSGETISASCRGYDTSKVQVGAQVSAVGIIFPGSYSNRRFKGRALGIVNPSAISVLDNRPTNPFDVAALDETTLLNPSSIQALGRRKAAGIVLAVWGKNLLLKTGGRWPVKVDIAHQPMPACGQDIEVSGLTDTDLFQLCLCRASWRTFTPAVESKPADTAETPEKVDLPEPWHVGHAIRIHGIVFDLPEATRNDISLLVEIGSRLIPVDTSANPGCLTGVSIGCTVDITGICVLEAEHWRPNAVFPHVLGYRIIPRSSADIVVTARPPWWTIGRLLAVIGSLFASLLALLLWNMTLKRLVGIKSRELADGEISRAEAAVKVYERTRLAVELHDSVAQSLTGVSMEIRAARKARNLEGLGHHLTMATLSLESCRSDLRDCLWDLRNLTLEEGSMEDAIRKTLAPRLGDAELAVRFNVGRERFTDNTAHTILRILRELATNAVRHGKATSLKVAGSIENGKLHFSLRDNGCGFDPATAPSMSEGHFGLQGIRDRINILGGTMDVESAPGKGSHVTIAINLPTGTSNT